MMTKKKKEEIERFMKLLLEHSDKIKAITKTRFINELRKIKSDKIHLNNILKYMLFELEGSNIGQLKDKLKTKKREILHYIDKSEKEIIKNTLKKIKHTYTIIADKREPIVKNLLEVVKKKRINIINKLGKKTRFEHIDAVLIYAKHVDSEGNIVSNKNIKKIIEKSKEFGFPIYCYTHSLNFTPKIKNNKNIIKPDSVNLVISELGIFEPEMFVQELKLKHKWL